jgi:hypothetical protein
LTEPDTEDRHATEESEVLLTLPQIVDAAQRILAAEAPGGQPMLMSRLGLRLSSTLGGDNLRAALGQKKLREVLSFALGDQVVFEGPVSSLTVRLSNQNGQPSRTQRFDPALWAAFAKVISDNKVRHLKVSKPIDFKDCDEGTPLSVGWVVVDRELIPDPEMPKPTRDSEIIKSIYSFAENHSLPVASFLASNTRPVRNAVTSNPSPSSGGNEPRRWGASALLAMIEAVPASERQKYSLPLDLLHRLLTL